MKVLLGIIFNEGRKKEYFNIFCPFICHDSINNDNNNEMNLIFSPTRKVIIKMNRMNKKLPQIVFRNRKNDVKEKSNNTGKTAKEKKGGKNYECRRLYQLK